MNEDTATSAAPAEQPEFAPDAASRQNGGEDTLAAELSAARAEAKENYDKFLYAKADFENYKKRMDRELARIALDGRKAVLRKVLPVLDNLERALAFEDSEGVRGGLQATLRMFETTLAGENVKAVSLKGALRSCDRRSDRDAARTARHPRGHRPRGSPQSLHDRRRGPAPRAVVVAKSIPG
jgi:molecular chaperone GrpE (heat shock protein)